MVDERILEAIKDEEPVADEPKVEQVNETATETTPETTPETTQEVEAPVKTYTQDDWDKMTYSFKRQLGKQKDKFESQISDYPRGTAVLTGCMSPRRTIRGALTTASARTISRRHTHRPDSARSLKKRSGLCGFRTE